MKVKKMNLTFVGDVEVASYDTYLDGKSLTTILAKSILGDVKDNMKGLARVTMTIEPMEDAGLNVEVEE